MINVKITMVNGTEYNIRNIADSVKDFYRNAIAPYGMGMSFMPVIGGTLINTANIVSITEMSEEEVAELNKVDADPVEGIEEVIGLRETEVEVENLETEPEAAQ